jgi:hypothetical protein
MSQVKHSDPGLTLNTGEHRSDPGHLKHHLETRLYPLLFVAAASIPSLGLGVYQLEGEECKELVLQALKMGYRLIDTAQVSTYSISAEFGEICRPILILGTMVLLVL